MNWHLLVNDSNLSLHILQFFLILFRFVTELNASGRRIHYVFSSRVSKRRIWRGRRRRAFSVVRFIITAWETDTFFFFDFSSSVGFSVCKKLRNSVFYIFWTHLNLFCFQKLCALLQLLVASCQHSNCFLWCFQQLVASQKFQQMKRCRPISLLKQPIGFFRLAWSGEVLPVDQLWFYQTELRLPSLGILLAVFLPMRRSIEWFPDDQTVQVPSLHEELGFSLCHWNIQDTVNTVSMTHLSATAILLTAYSFISVILLARKTTPKPPWPITFLTSNSSANRLLNPSRLVREIVRLRASLLFSSSSNEASSVSTSVFAWRFFSFVDGVARISMFDVSVINGTRALLFVICRDSSGVHTGDPKGESRRSELSSPIWSSSSSPGANEVEGVVCKLTSLSLLSLLSLCRIIERELFRSWL